MYKLDENRFIGSRIDIFFGKTEDNKPLIIDLNFILNMVLVGNDESGMRKFITKLQNLQSQLHDVGSETYTDVPSVPNNPNLEFFDNLERENNYRMQKAREYANSSPASRFLPLGHKIIFYENFDGFITNQGMHIKTIELEIIRKILTFTRMTQLHQFFCLEDIDNLDISTVRALAPYSFDFFVIFDNENLQKFISAKRFYKFPQDLQALGPKEALVVDNGVFKKFKL